MDSIDSKVVRAASSRSHNSGYIEHTDIGGHSKADKQNKLTLVTPIRVFRSLEQAKSHQRKQLYLSLYLHCGLSPLCVCLKRTR
jgi:hypothetical protein